MWLALAKLALQLGGSAVIDAIETYVKDLRAREAGRAEQRAVDNAGALAAAEASNRNADSVRALDGDALADRVRSSAGIDYD